MGVLLHSDRKVDRSLHTQTLFHWMMTNHQTPKFPNTQTAEPVCSTGFVLFYWWIMSAEEFCQQLCEQIKRRSENYYESKRTSLEGHRKCWKHTRMCRGWRISAKWPLQSDKFCMRVTATESRSSLPAAEWRDGNVRVFRRNVLLLLFLHLIIIIISALFL